MEKITIKSKVSATEVEVGRIDKKDRMAIFPINANRYFIEASAMGIDRSIFNRKAIQNCDKICFKIIEDISENLKAGKVFKVSKTDFQDNCWQYPKKPNPSYKATPSRFAPKLVICLDKMIELDKKFREEEDQRQVIESTR